MKTRQKLSQHDKLLIEASPARGELLAHRPVFGLVPADSDAEFESGTGNIVRAASGFPARKSAAA